VAYKQVLQAEGGFSANEPSQLAVKEAIESAVIHLIVQGARDKAWFLRNESDWAHPTVQAYLREADGILLGSGNEGSPIQSARPGNVMILPTPQPQSARPAPAPAPAASTRPAASAGAPAVATPRTSAAPAPTVEPIKEVSEVKKAPETKKPASPAKAESPKRSESADKPLAPASLPPLLPNNLEPVETPSLPPMPPASEEGDKLMSNPMPLNVSQAAGAASKSKTSLR